MIKTCKLKSTTYIIEIAIKVSCTTHYYSEYWFTSNLRPNHVGTYTVFSLSLLCAMEFHAILFITRTISGNVILYGANHLQQACFVRAKTHAYNTQHTK